MRLLSSLAALALCAPFALAADPPIIRSAKSGAWTVASTWEGNAVPGAGARVLIREGHRVTYDTKSDAVIRAISVSGTLAFAADQDTVLNVGLLKIQPGDDYSEDGFDCEGHATAPEPGKPLPALIVGEPNAPIAKTALIRLHHIEGLDKEKCPRSCVAAGEWSSTGARCRARGSNSAPAPKSATRP